MIIEKLDASKFDELKDVADGVVPPAASTEAFVCRDADGKIVGRAFLMGLAHLEGTWVDEKYRGSTIAARLIRRLEIRAMGLGIKQILAFSPPEAEGYMARLGYEKLPYTIWSKKVDKCQ